MADERKPKTILISEPDKRRLAAKAALAGKDLKLYISDLISILVEFEYYASAKWLFKQTDKK